MFSKAWRIFKRVCVFLLILLAIVVGAWFASENVEPISPLFFGHTVPAMSIGLYLVAALIVGIILGWGLSFVTTQAKVLRINRELKRKSKQVQQLDAQLASAKSTVIDVQKGT